MKVRLTGIEYGAEGINLYRLASLSGEPLPPFEAGAHIDLQVTDDLARQYSLLFPPPSATEYQIAVQHAEEGRGGSRTLHRHSVVGSVYEISPPRNHFPLRAGGEGAALFAGGIGITPIVSMYRQLKRRGQPVKLFYWTASPERTLFLRELAAEDAAAVHLYHTAGHPAAVPRLASVLGGIPWHDDVYCCGPQRMLDEFDRLTASRPADRVHRECFSPSAEALVPGDSFRVFLKRSQKSVLVGADETLLAACLAADIDMSYSCEEGICGACEVKVLAGQVIHRDSVLSPAQREKSGAMMACCSRGVGDTLVLDL